MASLAAAHGLQDARAAVAVAPRLQTQACELSRTQAWLLCSMCDRPGSRIKLVCPTLGGGFFTTEAL